MTCTCSIDYGHGHDADYIDYCPLHAAAPALLEALEAAYEKIYSTFVRSRQPITFADELLLEAMSAAIRTAKGGK